MGLSRRPQLAHSHNVLAYRASAHARHSRTRSWREYISVGLTEHSALGNHDSGADLLQIADQRFEVHHTVRQLGRCN